MKQGHQLQQEQKNIPIEYYSFYGCRLGGRPKTVK